jgi:hypothetical protein
VSAIKVAVVAGAATEPAVAPEPPPAQEAAPAVPIDWRRWAPWVAADIALVLPVLWLSRRYVLDSWLQTLVGAG